MACQKPVKEFNSLLSTSSVLFVVFYRGHWCPFCQSYLRTLHGLSSSVASIGGKTLIVTSQHASFLPEMRRITGYSGDAIVDTENTLVGFVKERFNLEIAVTEKKGYEHGMAQPAILVLRGGEKGKMVGEEEAVLEKWAIVPCLMNMGGACDRPDLVQVWDNVKAKLEGKGVVHEAYSKMGILGTLLRKLFG